MPLVDLEYYYDKDSLQMINQLIETFDTGISQVKMEEITLDELSNAMPKPIFDKVMNQVKSRIEEQENSSFCITMRSNENFFNIDVQGHNELKITTIRLHHNRSFYDFSFEEESDGTRRLFDLMDMLLNKREDVIYVVDELERSLHPKLTEHFLKLFMELHKDHRMQLLFTTHESSIMDQTIFRRDEIWFIERNADNFSTIYSLDRFKERYDKVLSKAYLEGRYGAIPVLTSFDFREEV
ncbi:AAA15 family ATPase/GTPase [Anaerotaenia torta]|uniref:AAA family ATPase n=1 Tax=Anaerotaenia torta TaxID=433293 RepID=UPI003D1EC88D